MSSLFGVDISWGIPHGIPLARVHQQSKMFYPTGYTPRHLRYPHPRLTTIYEYVIMIGLGTRWSSIDGRPNASSCRLMTTCEENGYARPYREDPRPGEVQGEGRQDGSRRRLGPNGPNRREKNPGVPRTLGFPFLYSTKYSGGSSVISGTCFSHPPEKQDQYPGGIWGHIDGETLRTGVSRSHDGF